MAQVIDLKDTTFLIPVRIDSLERLENLKAVTSYIVEHFSTTIILLEADAENSGILKRCLSDKIKIIFVKDHDETFHRTKYINMLTSLASTPFIAVWDADVIVHPQQILSAVESLRSYNFDFIFPYDGRFVETGISLRKFFIENHDIKPLEESSGQMFIPYTAIACGGGFLANKDAYSRAGMENEKFYGWGPEDGERLRRWRILEMRIGRVKGPMFHLFHPRGLNSSFKSEQDRFILLNELNRISNMSKAELEYEISTWGGKL